MVLREIRRRCYYQEGFGFLDYPPNRVAYLVVAQR